MPFEEDDKDPSIWFLDHNYHESMFSMFKRINGTVHFNSKVQFSFPVSGRICDRCYKDLMFMVLVQPRSMS